MCYSGSTTQGQLTDLTFESLGSLVISDCRPPMISVPAITSGYIEDILEDIDFSGNQLTTGSVEGNPLRFPLDFVFPVNILSYLPIETVKIV